MSNIVFLLTIFVFILVITSWITSEIISNKTRKENNNLVRRSAILEKEALLLQSELTKQTNNYTRIKEEYEQIKEAKAKARVIETNYRKLNKQFERTSEGIELIRDEISSNKYSNNSLAKEVIKMLDQHCPNTEQRAQQKDEKTKDSFKRIKTAIGSEAG